MGLHRILYIRDQGLAVFRRDQGVIREEAHFSLAPEDQARYTRFLDLAPSRYDLIWDLGQEIYREEALPRLRGGERHQLVQRKLAQHFPHIPFRGALSLGTTRQQREEEHFLFLALAAPEPIQAWVAPLEARQLVVGRVTCLALILARLVRLGWLPGQGLLLTRQGDNLRQSYFAQGQLHFSRQVTLPEGPEALPQLLRETAHCHQYLLGQRLLERHQPLTVHLLSPGENAAPGATTEGAQEQRWFPLEVAALARHLSLPAAPGLTLPQLWVQALLRKPPSTVFAPAALGQPYRWQCWERGLVGAGVGSFCLGLALGAQELGQAHHWQQVASNNRQALAAHPGALPRPEKKAANASAAPLSVPPALLTQLELLEKQRPDPRPLFLQLSRLLDRAPGLGLNRLAWVAGKADEEGAEGKPPPAPAPATATPHPQGPHLALEGEILGAMVPSPTHLESDPVKPLDQFRQALAATPGLQGRIQEDEAGASPAFRGEIWAGAQP